MKLFISFFLLLSSLSRAVSIPATTELQVRLTSEAASSRATGQPISGVILIPVFISGRPALGAGTRLTGMTSDAKPAKAKADGVTEQPATLKIVFNKIQDSTGHSKAIYAIVTAVDNARETVDQSGLITGISASQTLSARIDQGINKLANQYAQFAQILSGIKGAFVKEADPEIDYKPGVELTLKLTRPLDWNSPAAASIAPVSSIAPADALDSLVNIEPFRTVAERPPSPSDMTNLMFIGTIEQVQQAFHLAGWFTADRLSQTSKMETARAIIEDRGYSEAPMSILFLDGRPPDLALQKQNDTFSMRHHIRLWLRPQTFNGQPVWVAAATHDISITFSPESKSFTHRIDPHIDGERAKVVNDLLFTGAIRGIALVDRSGIPEDASNATGDRLITDGKMAVLEF